MQSPQALHGALSLQRLIFVPPSRKYGLFYHKQINLLVASSVSISVYFIYQGCKTHYTALLLQAIC